MHAPLMPLCDATTDENNRPPLDKGGLQGGGAWKFANLSLPPEGVKKLMSGRTESL